MGKKKARTPRSRVRQSLRKLWLTSRERSAALKRDGYRCRDCGRKQSRAKGKEFKVEVHHRRGILNWDELLDAVFEFLLCDPEELETLCPKCHEKREVRRGDPLDVGSDQGR